MKEKEGKIIEFPGEAYLPPRYSPRNYREELFGIGTLVSLSAGLSTFLVSAVFSEFYPEAFYGVLAGAVLITASVPGILYFTTMALDAAVHH